MEFLSCKLTKLISNCWKSILSNDLVGEVGSLIVDIGEFREVGFNFLIYLFISVFYFGDISC